MQNNQRDVAALCERRVGDPAAEQLLIDTQPWGRIDRATQTLPLEDTDSEPEPEKPAALPRPHAVRKPDQASPQWQLGERYTAEPAAVLPPQPSASSWVAGCAEARRSSEWVGRAEQVTPQKPGGIDQALQHCRASATAATQAADSARCVEGASKAKPQPPGDGSCQILDGLAEGLVRTLPGELSDSCCSSTQASPVRPAAQPTSSGSAAQQTPTDSQRPAGAAVRACMEAGEPFGRQTGLEGSDAHCSIMLTPAKPSTAGQYPGRPGEGYPEQSRMHEALRQEPLVQPPVDELCERPDLQPERLAELPTCLDRRSGSSSPPVLRLEQAAAELEALCALSLLGLSMPEQGPDRPDACMLDNRHASLATHGNDVSSLNSLHGSGAELSFQQAERSLARLLKEAGSIFDGPAGGVEAAAQPRPQMSGRAKSAAAWLGGKAKEESREQLYNQGPQGRAQEDSPVSYGSFALSGDVLHPPGRTSTTLEWWSASC